MKLIGCVKETWKQALIWCQWLADPDGPSHKKKIISISFCIFGSLMLICGISVLVILASGIAFGQIFSEFKISKSQPTISGYIAGILVFIGGFFWVLGKHPARVDLKTAEYNEEIDVLISNIRLRTRSMSNDQKNESKKLIDTLDKFKKMPTEVSILRLTPLRKLQADIYHENELYPQIYSELESLKYYSGRKDETYNLYKGKVDEVKERNQISEDSEELREYLSIIRAEVDNVRYNTGYGEAIIESMTYWSVISGIALLVIGLSPLFDPPYFENELYISHWAIFGFQGALLSTIIYMRKLEPFDIGEDDGNSQLRKMVMGMFIGAIAAIMLYLAIQSGMFGGKALPKLTSNKNGIDDPMVINALSVFWAIAAGFSGSTLIERLLRQTEQNESST